MALSRFLVIIVVLVAAKPASAGQITSLAYVNLHDGPHQSQSSEPYTTVSASSNASIGSAWSRVSTTPSLAVYATASGGGISYPAVGSGGYLSTFGLNRDLGLEPLPLTLNLRLTGSLNSSSTPGNMGSIGMGSIRWEAQTTTSRHHGTTTLGSQGGIPFQVSTGDQLTGTIAARIVPVITVGGSIPVIALSPEDGDYLGIDFDLFSFNAAEPIDASFWEGVAANIATAIFDWGLPSAKIAPGINASVGFDTTFIFDTLIELSLSFLHSDGLFVSLVGEGKASTGGVGVSDYSHTLELVSATVPNDYRDTSIDGLQIEFELGAGVPVTRASVPASPTLALFAAAFIVIMVRDKKGKRAKGQKRAKGARLN